MKAVMGEHAMRYWRGESGHAKMGVTWLHSGAAGTGKTYVLKLINALLGKGFPMVALSGSSTPVAIQILLKYVSNSSACIDDYVPPRGPDLAYQQLVRQIFDQTSRNIGGENARSYKCNSTAIVSSNVLLCPDSAPITSRLFSVGFKPIDHAMKRDNASDVLMELEDILPLTSSLMLDLDTFSLHSVNGNPLVLDKEAFRDCSNFLYQAVVVWS